VEKENQISSHREGVASAAQGLGVFGRRFVLLHAVEVLGSIPAERREK